MDLADSTELKHGGRVTDSRHTSHVKYRLRLPGAVHQKSGMDHIQSSTVSLLRIQTEDLISSHDQTCKKSSENALDSVVVGPSLPPRTTAQRRVHEPPDAGGGLDSRGVRSPTGEHETRAKDHAWRRKGRIPRVAERLLLDVGGEGKRSLPRALF